MTEREFVAEINKNKRIILKAYNAYAAKYNQEDIVQEVILETWKTINNFKNNCKFSTWLYNIARNTCIDVTRRSKNIPNTVGLEDYAEVIAESSNAKEMVKQLREAIRYDSVIDNIEEPWRSTFEMYLHGISFKEMSDQTGVDENTLRVYLHRIKKRLYLRYGQSDHIK